MGLILGGEDRLEEDMATHSSILAWRIPWTEEPGGLPSMGLQSQTQPQCPSTRATQGDTSSTLQLHLASSSRKLSSWMK